MSAVVCRSCACSGACDLERRADPASRAMELLESSLGSSGHQLEGFTYGGGPCATALSANIRKKFPAVYGAQGYGATELSSAAATNHGEDYLLRASSPLCAYQHHIDDDVNYRSPIYWTASLLVRDQGRRRGGQVGPCELAGRDLH